MNELALFAGIGRGILGGKLLGWRTVGAVEIDAYCREILLRRQEEGILEAFPIWDDVRTFDGTAWRGCVDIITAGFPCQPFSVAGKQQGEADKRNMWPSTIRIIKEARPQWVLLENVPGLRCPRWEKGNKMPQEASYIGRILSDLAESGYHARWRVLSAAEVGAPHKRDRLWIMCWDSNCFIQDKIWRLSQRSDSKPTRICGSQTMADSEVPIGWRASSTTDSRWRDKEIRGCHLGRHRIQHWTTEPDVGRVAHGIPYRVDRLKALGNAQVPGVAALAWLILSDISLLHTQTNPEKSAVENLPEGLSNG